MVSSADGVAVGAPDVVGDALADGSGMAALALVALLELGAPNGGGAAREGATEGSTEGATVSTTTADGGPDAEPLGSVVADGCPEAVGRVEVAPSAYASTTARAMAAAVT